VEGKDTEIVESPKLEVWIYNLEKINILID
jgi:hypothetical protein